MSKYRDLNYGDRLPETFLDAIEEFISTYASPNFLITNPSSTTIKVAASTDNDQVAIAINGRWRYITADVTASHPGGGAATYDIYVTGSDNAFSGGEPETDSTVYAFALAIRALASPPATALYRKVGTLVWDGAAITSVTQTVGAPQLSSVTTDLTARSAAATQVKIGSISAAAGVALGSGGDVTMVRNATGPRLDVNTNVSAPGFMVSGTLLAASHLSNGVIGSGAVVLAVSPTFTGAPLSTTPAADDNSTKIATTAYVLGQAGGSAPIMDGAATVGVSTRWSRQDHVHPTDTSRAPLASPTLTGTPAAPTPSVDDNTTKIATTAYVIGQASAVGDGTPAMDGVAARGTAIHWARADHVHPTNTAQAPLASPTFTGTPAAPTAAVDTNTTQLATTAFVLAQASAVGDGTPAIDGTAARGTSTHYARADHVHPTDTSRAATASPTFTGAPLSTTAAVDTNTTQIATTAFVVAQAAAATPIVDGTGTVGTSLRYARADHIHPTDTSRAPTASPTLTGTVTIPTPSTSDNSTKAASTAFVRTNLGVSGAVASNAVSQGTGFSVGLAGSDAGGDAVYTISFSPGLSTTPIVTVTTKGFKLMVQITSVSSGSFAVQFIDTNSNRHECDFMFHALLPTP